MKTYPLYLIALAGLLAAGWYWNFHGSQNDGPRTLTALERTGDECELIAEKAAMALPEMLPFQKLEKAARKSRVLQTCMQDRGYIENPAWIKYAQPIAAKQAEVAHISVDEAYETFRREQLKTFQPSDKAPPYWIASKP